MMQIRIFARNDEEKTRWAKALSISDKLESLENELNELKNSIKRKSIELDMLKADEQETIKAIERLKRDIGLEEWR